MEQKKMMPLATMKDVAREAGVSTATVSRALMNPEKVSATTRQKVEQAMQDVGYSPNNGLRQLKKNDSRAILVVIPMINAPFFVDVIRGIEDTLNEHGYLPLITTCEHPQSNTPSLVNFLLSKQCEGVILLAANFPFSASKEEQKHFPPMVMANEFAPDLELPTVHIDNLTAAYQAVHHLQQLGHKRIATICGPLHVPLCQLRQQGYVQALQRSGIAVEKTYQAQGDFSYASGANCFRQLMELPQPPTAIFCQNDTMALGALAQARKMNIKVPEDVSLIGFDDIDLTEFCTPPLTTMAHPRYESGQKVAQLLMRILQGEKVPPGSALLDCELVIRETTAPPKH